MHHKTALLAATSLSLMTVPAMAANTTVTTNAPPVTELEEVVVRALPLDQRGDEVIGNVAVLSGD